MFKKKKTKIAVLSIVLAAVMLLATLTVYAYFTTKVYVYTDEGKQEFQTGMQLQLLFGELTVAKDTMLYYPSYTSPKGEGNVVYTDKETGVAYDPDAEWGSAKNPYVISETRHLQNLSALQNVGYFDLMYLNSNFKKDDDSGEYHYQEGHAKIPYFLVCASDGKPVAVGGIGENGVKAETIEIKPIGSAQHPFVGVIGGAFVDGTVTIDGKSSSVSSIYNVKVQTTTNQTDVGLFGYVGFLGEEIKSSDLSSGVRPEFNGVTSSIQDLLLFDVRVVVDKPTVIEIISDLFGPVWSKYFDGDSHRYTYTDKKDNADHPSETHHIGIFAGHVSYANIDNISVYYSADDIHALDLTGGFATDNYYSASGILGMIYNMNCKVENVTDASGNVTGNCVIKMGTGSSSDSSGAVMEGTGTGGGIYSGNGRGYVTAAEIFTTFNNVYVEKENEELLWRYKTSQSSTTWVEGAILLLEVKGADNSVSYTLVDGTVATISNDKSQVTAGGKTWDSFFIRSITTANGVESINYVTASGAPAYEPELMGNKYNGQPIWKYSAGGDGIWHYGIRVLMNLDGEYTLEDGKTVVKLVDIQETGKKQIIDEAEGLVWENFFISQTTLDEDGETTLTIHYMYDNLASQGKWTVSGFEVKPLALIQAHGINIKTGDMEDLCREWNMTTTEGEEVTAYYFYDGVFTFGLSSSADTLRDTWPDGVAPKLYLGPQTPDGWKINEDRGNRTLVALVKAITSNEDLDKAIAANKQFYIAAQPLNEDEIAENAYFMSLITQNNTADSSKILAGQLSNQKVPLGSSVLKDTLQEYYATGAYTDIPTVPLTGQTTEQPMSGVSLDDLKTDAFWDSYDVLNIGRTSNNVTLASLKTKYNVVPTNVNNKYYYYLADEGTYVGTANGTTALTLYDYTHYGNYIYYTVSSQTPNENVYSLTRENVGSDRRPQYEYTENMPIEDCAYTSGIQSGTRYERVRDYTFEFFYQPPPITDENGEVVKIQEPISLGTTQLRVIGLLNGQGSWNNNNYWTHANYWNAYGVVMMPNFTYGMVYYGQENFSLQIQQTLSSRNYTFGQRNFTPSGGLNGNATITAGNGSNSFNLTYSDDSKDININASNIPMVNVTAGRMHGTTEQLETAPTAVVMGEGYASVRTNTTIDTYSCYDVATGTYYRKAKTNNSNLTQVNAPSNGDVLLNRYPAYEFSSNAVLTSDKSYLQFLHQYLRDNYYLGRHGDDYELWAGTGSQYDELYMGIDHTTEGVLVFEEGENYCYIQYTYTRNNNSLTRYVGYDYDEVNQTLDFSLKETKSEQTKIYVYVIEGILDASSGVNTFVPQDSNYPVLSADQYVFWPQTTLKQGTTLNPGGVYANNGTTLVAGKTDTAALSTTEDPIYTMIPLTGEGGLNWGTADGHKLGDYGLDKKFQMADQSFFGQLNIDQNGDISSLVNSGMMVAPVGDGEGEAESIIPKGCVAFRVGTEGKQTIRIIVAVPTTDYYLNEDGFSQTMDLVNDYYIGVWKMPEIKEGRFIFRKSEAIEKFELPRSYSFGFEDTPVELDKTGTKHYVDVQYNNVTYRTYLNGDTFLVAYEFTIDGSDLNAGTYIIGSAHGPDSDNVIGNIPMEIVHFSVSGTASAGSDGIQGSQIGAIDFVYDNTANKIVTIGQAGANTGINNGVDTDKDGVIDEYYSNYYSSHCLLYTDLKEKSSDSYIKLNQVKLSVRRWLRKNGDNYETVITCTAISDDSNQTAVVKFNRYSGRSDIVLLNGKDLSSTTQ